MIRFTVNRVNLCSFFFIIYRYTGTTIFQSLSASTLEKFRILWWRPLKRFSRNLTQLSRPSELIRITIEVGNFGSDFYGVPRRGAVAVQKNFPRSFSFAQKITNAEDEKEITWFPDSLQNKYGGSGRQWKPFGFLKTRGPEQTRSIRPGKPPGINFVSANGTK